MEPFYRLEAPSVQSSVVNSHQAFNSMTARVVCADIYTGVSTISDRLESYIRLRPPSSINLTKCYSLTYWDGDTGRVSNPAYETCLQEFPDDGWTTFVNTTIFQTKEALRRQVLRKMPLFEMRS